MFCYNCGKQLLDGDRFCPHCGAAQGAEGPIAAPAEPVATPVEEVPLPSRPADDRTPVSEPVHAAATPVRKVKKENIFGGVIGALFGGVLGFCSMMMLSQSDLPSGIALVASGVMMAVYVFLNWRLFGRKLGNAGMVICTIVMFAVIYFSDQIIFANAVYHFSTSMDVPFRYALVFGRLAGGSLSDHLRFAHAVMGVDPAVAAMFRRILIVPGISGAISAGVIICYTLKHRPMEATAKRRGGLIFLCLLLLTVVVWGSLIAFMNRPGLNEYDNNPVYEVFANYADRQIDRDAKEAEASLKALDDFWDAVGDYLNDD